jgi:hypothetical protein
MPMDEVTQKRVRVVWIGPRWMGSLGDEMTNAVSCVCANVASP